LAHFVTESGPFIEYILGKMKEIVKNVFLSNGRGKN